MPGKSQCSEGLANGTRWLRSNLIPGCRLGLLSVLALLGLSLAGCSIYPGKAQRGSDLPVCHIVYDAGSSGTRLFVYERTSTGWLAHKGPSAGALADPVRGNRGKSMQDAGAVTDDIVNSLERLRRNGPPASDGLPEWPAFDWKKHCRVETVSVYATAGMRIAEQQNPQDSQLLWQILNRKLSARLQQEVTTRTLMGFEEGLYAWLAIREEQGDAQFGLAEMGGVSLQVTFPCANCVTSRQIKSKDQYLSIYSLSLLGWGQDEAWKKHAHLPACQAGSGKENPDWTVADCSEGLSDFSKAIADVLQNMESAEALRWYLTEAFRYAKDTDIDDYCRLDIKSSYEPASACFRAVYLESVLNSLGLSEALVKSSISWTLGAVVCTDTQCLESE